MVELPSTITVRIWEPVNLGDQRAVPFEVLNANGDPAVKDGFCVLGEIPS